MKIFKTKAPNRKIKVFCVIAESLFNIVDTCVFMAVFL